MYKMNNKDLLKQYVDTGQKISKYQISKLPPNLLRTYLRKRIIALNQAELMYINDGNDTMIDDEFDITSYEYSLFNDEDLKRFIDLIFNLEVETDYDLIRADFPDDVKKQYVDNIIKRGWTMAIRDYMKLGDNLKAYYLDYILKNNKWFTKYDLEATPDHLAMVYLKHKLQDPPWELKDYEQARYDKIKNEY